MFGFSSPSMAADSSPCPASGVGGCAGEGDTVDVWSTGLGLAALDVVVTVLRLPSLVVDLIDAPA